MSFFASKFVAPVYRLFYGPPLSGLEKVRRTELDEDCAPCTDGGRPCYQSLTVIADGVGGLDVCGTGLRYVMAAQGLSHAVEVCAWGHGFGRWLADLTDVNNVDAKARTIAQLVKNFKTDQPEGVVYLLGKSGGAGVVVRALEQLENNTVERVVLLAPALSPTYDLNQALRAVHHEIVVFWSPFDVLILGLGTIVFGTIDRVHTAGAGLVGFAAPSVDVRSGAAGSGYTKVRHVRWQPAMVATGYLGGHFGPDSPLFLKKYVLPLLRPEIRKEC
jgi:hypothetical protein